MGALSQTIGVVKHLDDCRNYNLLDLSVGGSYAPGEPRCRIEEPALYEPLGCACGLSAAQAACDPKDSFGGHVGDGVVDPPGGGDFSCLYGPLRGEDDLRRHGKGLIISSQRRRVGAFPQGAGSLRAWEPEGLGAWGPERLRALPKGTRAGSPVGVDTKSLFCFFRRGREYRHVGVD